MKCVRCGKNMRYHFCLHCGYMLNGNVIDTKKKIEASNIEKYLGDDYNDVLYNENIKTIFYLGPLYFSYHNHLFLGTILLILDSLFIITSRIITQMFFNFCIQDFCFNFDLVILIIAFSISRLFYMMFANNIYLRLTKRKIRSLKKTVLKINDRSIMKIIISVLLVLLFYFSGFLILAYRS